MNQKLEELSINAYPALSTMLLNGWVLRFSNGYSKRANSVNPIYQCSIDDTSNIEVCEDLYHKNGFDTVFKLTECDYSFELDKILEKRGYSYEAKTNVMLINIANYEVLQDEIKDTIILTEPTEEWINAYVKINNINPANIPTLKKILAATIPDTYCACIYHDSEIIAVGLGVAQGEYVGMFDICVSKEMRRMGLGTKVMKSLISYASSEGCKYSYLQVIDDNEPAKKLYDMLGYEKQYSYWYRVKKHS